MGLKAASKEPKENHCARDKTIAYCFVYIANGSIDSQASCAKYPRIYYFHISRFSIRSKMYIKHNLKHWWQRKINFTPREKKDTIFATKMHLESIYLEIKNYAYITIGYYISFQYFQQTLSRHVYIPYIRPDKICHHIAIESERW